MSLYAANLPQTATYWRCAGSDGFGGYTFDPPVAIKVRWQDEAKLARDAQGAEFTTEAVVYCGSPVKSRGYLLLDDSQAATPPDGAKEIRGVYATFSLDGEMKLIKAML